MNSNVRLAATDPAFEGGVVVGVARIERWPPATRWPILRHPISDGVAEIIAFPSGRLRARIRRLGGNTLSVRSGLLSMPSPYVFRVAFGWESDHCTLAAEGEIIGSTKDPKLSERFFFPRPADIESVGDNARNRAARRSRQDWANAYLKIERPNQRPLSRAENLQTLERAILQLQHLIALVRAGDSSLMPSMAAQIRSLVCRRGSSLHPLLQRCAGQFGVPLDVFSRTGATSSEAQPASTINLSLSVEQRSNSEERVDFDVWLEGVGAIIGNRSYTRDQLISTIANTFGGAHHSPVVDRLSEYLLSIEADFLRGHETILFGLAEEICKLGTLVLSHSPSENGDTT